MTGHCRSTVTIPGEARSNSCEGIASRGSGKHCKRQLRAIPRRIAIRLGATTLERKNDIQSSLASPASVSETAPYSACMAATLTLL